MMKGFAIYKWFMVIVMNILCVSLFAVTTDNLLNDKLSDLVKNAHKHFEVSAFSLSVLTQNDKQPQSYVAGTTKLNNSIPITATNLFKVGSIAKTYTAFIVLNMVAEHKIKLDDHLVKYLPQYAHWSKITISELLNQTSGIMDYDETTNWWPTLMSQPYKIWQPSELVNRVYNLPLKFTPGTSFAYSNTNYILLGLVAEKVSHKKIDVLMRNLIQEADLKHTFYSPDHYDKDIFKQITHGYFRNQFDQTNMNESWLRTAGALLSTPNDMCLWLHYFLTSKLHPISNIKFVNADDEKDDSGVIHFDYGSGLYKRNSKLGYIYFTPGLSSGYVSMMGYVPKKHIYFAYSTSNSPVPGLHKYMISNLIEILTRYGQK